MKKPSQESIFKKPGSKPGTKLPPLEIGSGQLGSANENSGLNPNEDGKELLKPDKKRSNPAGGAQPWEVESSENVNLKSFGPKQTANNSVNLGNKSGELKVPSPDDDNKSRSGKGGKKENVLNGSFSASVQSVKQVEPLAKRKKRVILAVLAVVKFWRILDHIKQYGTSSNLYNIAFRSRKSVKKSIFPIAKNSTQVKTKVQLRFLIHPNSLFLTFWNLFLFLFVLYAMSLMPYLAVFVEEVSPFQSAFEDMMDIVFLLDLLLNFFTAIYNSKEE